MRIPKDKTMTITETILTAVVMLLGTEDVDYVILERELNEWKRISEIRRN